MNAIDTNVWIYSHDTRDPQRQKVAQDLIAAVASLALPWQVGCEFMAACRKLAAIGLDDAKAWSALAGMETMAQAILLPTPQLWQESRTLQTRHALSFWDALLVAACIQGGVQVLYTEDMGAPRQIDGLSLINPFLLTHIP